jgi:hypothetical protein
MFQPLVELREQIRAMTKRRRKELPMSLDFDWNCYSTVVGEVEWQRVDTQGNNPPAKILAFVVDYDAQVAPHKIEEYLQHVDVRLRPTYGEVTGSRNLRLLWLFEAPVRTISLAHAKKLLTAVSDYVGAATMLPGFDNSSLNPCQVWTNGGEWYKLGEMMPSSVIEGIAVDAFNKSYKSTHQRIDLNVVASEVERRFPDRWRGEFKEGAIGVRFWDANADNPRAAMVLPDGCYCLTGDRSFVSWIDIFGKEWVEESRLMCYAQAAEGIMYDDSIYWVEAPNGEWQPTSKDNVLLELAHRGIPRTRPREDNMSEAERVLRYIHVHKRIKGAIPLVNMRPGVMTYEGDLVLNISNLRALQPCPETMMVPERDFPFLWSVFQIIKGELGKQTFFGWLKVAYEAGYYYSPTYGQVMFMFGPKQNGKTLILNRVVTALLGGRQANPYQVSMPIIRSIWRSR